MPLGPASTFPRSCQGNEGKENLVRATMTTAMILCAGLGTRLRPLTNFLPKPLVWIGDRPLLAFIAERLKRGGVSSAVVNTSHLAERFDAALLKSLPLNVVPIHEPTIAGTAGGVAGAARALGQGDVLVWNGDILVDVDVGVLLRAHETHVREGFLSTLVVKRRGGPGEGTVGLAKDGSVVRLRGQVFGDEAFGADFVGVHVLGQALRERLPANGCLVGDVYIPLLAQHEKLATFTIEGEFRDIGTIGEYLAENLRWLETSALHVYRGRGAVVDAGVDLQASIVGEGATVRGSGVLRGVVVWPGAIAEAPLEDAVVLPDGQVCRR